MSCYQCPDNWFVAHLGRCRSCLYKSAALSLLLWCGWLAGSWAGWASRSLEMISLLVMAVAVTALLLAHLAVIGWRREWPP
ncbi:MAG: DUF3624 family protein [Corallincola sp.]|nr:DUF3624 family protein [Corallincola sp.]